MKGEQRPPRGPAPWLLDLKTPIPILHRDPRLIVALKPAGLLSAPERGGAARSLVEVLAEQGVVAQAVHRLDLDVSGALVLALDDEARVVHESTPIQPLDPDRPGHRDTLVITLRAGGFQGPDATS